MMDKEELAKAIVVFVGALSFCGAWLAFGYFLVAFGYFLATVITAQ